jgi:hypothetical protein
MKYLFKEPEGFFTFAASDVTDPENDRSLNWEILRRHQPKAGR